MLTETLSQPQSLSQTLSKKSEDSRLTQIVASIKEVINESIEKTSVNTPFNYSFSLPLPEYLTPNDLGELNEFVAMYKLQLVYRVTKDSVNITIQKHVQDVQDVPDLTHIQVLVTPTLKFQNDVWVNYNNTPIPTHEIDDLFRSSFDYMKTFVLTRDVKEKYHTIDDEMLEGLLKTYGWDRYEEKAKKFHENRLIGLSPIKPYSDSWDSWVKDTYSKPHGYWSWEKTTPSNINITNNMIKNIMKRRHDDEQNNVANIKRIRNEM